MTAQPDPTSGLVLRVGGRIFWGWTTIRLTRAIDRMCSDFELTASERWLGQDEAWAIQPFAPCTVTLGKDLLLTGYVDDYEPTVEAERHHVRISGRSKTADLVDCQPDIQSGQFRGYTLGAIARAICAPFNVEVVEETDTTQIVADATLQRSETAYKFLERLARLSRVLLTDDPQGRLVMTTTGDTTSTTRLLQGDNVMRARAKLSGRKRFSAYILKGQAGLAATGSGGASGTTSWSGAGGIGGGTTSPAAPRVATQLRAEADDPAVPRYRPRVALAESALNNAGMQERVNWMMTFAAGRATTAEISVPGFRQLDGSLWQINQLVPCTVPYLGLDQDLLVARTEMRLDERGHVTELTLGPPSGFAPDPGEVKLHKAKRGRKGKAGPNWDGAGT